MNVWSLVINKMTYRNSTYTAFYVDEEYFNNNLGAFVARDFCNFQLLKMWKKTDAKFPFIDAQGKTYNVRDGSDSEIRLKSISQPKVFDCNKDGKLLRWFQFGTRSKNSRI